MILNNADNIKLGSAQVEAVYLGADQVWGSASYAEITSPLPITFSTAATAAKEYSISGPLPAGTYTLRCRRPRTDGNLLVLPYRGFWSRANSATWANAQWTRDCPKRYNGAQYMEFFPSGIILVNVPDRVPDSVWHLIISGTVNHDAATDTWTWYDPTYDTLYPAGTYTVSMLPEELYPSGVNRPGWALTVAAFTAGGTQVVDYQEGYSSWDTNFTGRYTFTINEPCYITIYLFCSHYPNNVFSAPYGIWPRLERASAPSAFDTTTFYNDYQNDVETSITIAADIPSGGSISSGDGYPSLATRTGANILTIENLPDNRPQGQTTMHIKYKT